jgi:hypothetical protein
MATLVCRDIVKAHSYSMSCVLCSFRCWLLLSIRSGVYSDGLSTVEEEWRTKGSKT